MKPETAGEALLDMSQYKVLFGTTRVPNLGKDRLRYGKAENHILVVRNGHSFHVPVYNLSGSRFLTIFELEDQLWKCVKNSEMPNKHPVNLVSSDNRDEWAKVYQRMKEKHSNFIESYEGSLFVVGLDNPVRVGTGLTREEENMKNAIHGGGSNQNAFNRWYDKTLQVCSLIFLMKYNFFNF